MKQVIKRTIQILGVCAGVVVLSISLGACCKEDSAKSAACKEMTSTETCELCCDGGYSYTTTGGCKCY